MIRVVMVVASSRGGGAAHVRDLSLGLARRRYAVKVMPADGGHVTPEDSSPAGSPATRCRSTTGSVRRARETAWPRGAGGRPPRPRPAPRCGAPGRAGARRAGADGGVHGPCLAARTNPGRGARSLLGIERAWPIRKPVHRRLRGAETRIVSAAIAPRAGRGDPQRVDVDRYAPRARAGATRGVRRAWTSRPRRPSPRWSAGCTGRATGTPSSSRGGRCARRCPRPGS